jgi:hypothetical protein
MLRTPHNADTLRKIDVSLYAGVPVVVGTQFGDVTIRKALTPGYIAELVQYGTGEICTYGLTPSIAFMNLADTLRAARSKHRERAA